MKNRTFCYWKDVHTLVPLSPSGTSESWGVNGHTAQYTSPVFVVSQHKLVSGSGLQKRRSSPPTGLGRTYVFSLCLGYGCKWFQLPACRWFWL